MILALLSDIHGNREALEVCLADAESRGAEQYVFLGDLVGYGADPSFVIETVAALAAKGAIVIKGNHDVAVASGGLDMNGYARAAIDWTRERLNQDEKRFLADLPMSHEQGDVLFVHGDASDPSGWIYVMGAREAERSMRATSCRVTFTGHVHRPQLFSMPLSDAGRFGSAFANPQANGLAASLERNRKWHAVLGSVGQPRDSNPDAAYALYDDVNAKLTAYRLPYDVAKVAEKISAAGLPQVLADRLFLGR